MKLEVQVQGMWTSWEPTLQKEQTLSIRIWNGDMISLSQEKQGLRWLKGNENGAVVEDDFGKTTGNWSWIVWVQVGHTMIMPLNLILSVLSVLF